MHRFAISLAVSLGFISRGADDGDRRPESVTTAAVTVVAADTSIFAGGCFWCMEPPNGKIDGVLSTTSGCTSGAVANPTYDRVSAGGTGHTEAVRVVFDPARVSCDRLLGGVPAQHRSVRTRPAILRSRESVPKRHSSAHAAAEGRRRGFAPHGCGALFRARRHRDRAGNDVLCRRGSPSGLLHGESDTLPVPSLQLRR